MTITSLAYLKDGTHFSITRDKNVWEPCRDHARQCEKCSFLTIRNITGFAYNAVRLCDGELIIFESFEKVTVIPG
jgi:hypothetical protein